MAGCCGTARTDGKIKVRLPDGTVKEYATRPEAVGAVTRAGGGTILGR